MRRALLGALVLSGGGVAARTGRLLWRRREVNWASPERLLRDAFLRCQTMGGGDQPVLLLHALEGSADYFGSAFDELADPGPLLVPDLLGFGGSPPSTEGYTPDAHVAALVRMLDALEIAAPALVIGHGLGGLLGLRLAALHPRRVRAVMAISPPIYGDRETARRWLGGAGVRLARSAVRALPGGRGSGGATRILAGSWRPDLPMSVAGARMAAISGDAYWETLRECVVEADPASWLDQITCPVEFLIPAHDRALDAAYLGQLADRLPALTIARVDFGDARLPLTHPDGCLAAIDRFRQTLPVPVRIDPSQQ